MKWPFRLAAVLVLAGPATADPLTIVAQEMPGLLSAGGSLPYNRLLDALVDGSPVPVTVKTAPGYRGPRDWVHGKYRCIFGGISSPGHAVPPNDPDLTATEWASLVISAPFNLLTVHAWTRGGEPVVTNYGMLDGAVVAVDEVLSLDLGLHARKDLAGSRMMKVKTPWEALDLLAAGRVDLVYAYDNDVELYRREHDGRTFRADRDLKLLVLEESMMCWPGEGVAAFVAHVDNRLKALASSGELARLTLKDPGPRGAASDR